LDTVRRGIWSGYIGVRESGSQKEDGVSFGYDIERSNAGRGEVYRYIKMELIWII
jgi:hypothetical protein